MRQMSFWLLSSHFYSLIFHLIISGSLISQKLHINSWNFIIAHFYSFYDFSYPLWQLQSYPCSSTIIPGSLNLSFHIFILNNNSQKYYNFTRCSYTPLQLHVLYTLLGWGVTVQVIKWIYKFGYGSHRD